MKATTAFLAALALAATLFASAAEIAEIKLDRLLRDPSVCRGPDGAYYLTGTVSTRNRPVPSDGPLQRGDTPDYYENSGIYLWKSKDLTAWEPVGMVFDVKSVAAGGWGSQAWLANLSPVPDRFRAERVYGLVAPEIHYGNGAFWIAFSNSRQGTGLLKSASGKAEGPYEFVDIITAQLGDPSLLFDGTAADGKTGMYWVFDAGFLGSLTETDRRRPHTPNEWGPEGERRKQVLGSGTVVLAAEPMLLRPQPGSDGFPLTMGERGAFLLKAEGKYRLIATEKVCLEDGRIRWDTFVADAEQREGPYGPRRLLIPGGGQATVFQDDRGRWLAACAQNRMEGEETTRLVILEIHF
jgi:hypothetical protein